MRPQDLFKTHTHTINESESQEVLNATKSTISMAQHMAVRTAQSDLYTSGILSDISEVGHGLSLKAHIMEGVDKDGKPITGFHPAILEQFTKAKSKILNLANSAKNAIHQEILHSAFVELNDSEELFISSGAITITPITTNVMRSIDMPELFTDADAITVSSIPMDMSIQQLTPASGINGGTSKFTVSNKEGKGYLPSQLIETLYPFTIAFFIEQEYMHPCAFRHKLLTPIFDTSGELLATNHIDTIIELLGSDPVVSNGPARANNFTQFEARPEKTREMASSSVMIHVRALAITQQQYAIGALRAVYVVSLVKGINALASRAEDNHAKRFHDQIATEVVANGQFQGEGQVALSGIGANGVPNNSLYIRDLRMILETARQHFTGFKCSVITVHPQAILIFDSFYIKDQGFVPSFGYGTDVLGNPDWNGQVDKSGIHGMDPYINTGNRGTGRAQGMGEDWKAPSNEEIAQGRFNVVASSRKRSLLQMSAVLWEKHQLFVGTHTIEVMPDLNHKIYDSLTNFADVTSKVTDAQSMLVLNETLSTDLYLYDHTRVGILLTTGIRQLTAELQEWQQNAKMFLTAFELKEKAYLYPNALRLCIKHVKISPARNSEFHNVRMVSVNPTQPTP